MGSLAAAFGLDKVLPPNAVSGRSYFITALLRELMFKEAGLAGTDHRFERRRRQLRLLAGITTGLLLVQLVQPMRCRTTIRRRDDSADG